jgi:hypothetical protein
MSPFSFPRRQVILRGAVLAALSGLALWLAAARPVAAAEGPKRGDEDRPPAKPPVVDRSDEAGRGDDFGPPPRPQGTPPRDKDQRRPKPPRPDGPPRGPDDRQPGPPPGDDGPPRRHGPPGPGPDRQPGGPRPDWAAAEKNDPEMYKLMQAENDLDRRTHELARDYRDASQEGRAKIKQDVQKLVTQQFEARQQHRALQLKRLEDELKRFRDGMERREKDRQQIIEKRVSELLSEEAEAGF